MAHCLHRWKENPIFANTKGGSPGPQCRLKEASQRDSGQGRINTMKPKRKSYNQEEYELDNVYNEEDVRYGQATPSIWYS